MTYRSAPNPPRNREAKRRRLEWLRSTGFLRSLALFAILPFLTRPAYGWGCEGHQMIALIARSHLTPEASTAVDQLLRENPIDPTLNRFCKDRPADLMADSATWA